mgnify:CR=1 FL=1
MYESRAECRFLRSLGGDAVGMSTVPEIVSAHHCNMAVLCLSLITNKVVMAGDEDETDHGAVANHEEVLDAVQKRAGQIQQLVKKTVEIIGRDILPDMPDLPRVSLDVPEEELKTTQTGASVGSSVLYGAMLVAAGAFFGSAVGAARRR